MTFLGALIWIIALGIGAGVLRIAIQFRRDAERMS